MGRKATPSALREISGNAGRRPVNKNEFRPVAEAPDCPRHLKGESKKEWTRITVELAAYQMISAVDRGALAMLCTQWGRYVEAEDMIAEAAKKSADGNGLCTVSPNGHLVHSFALVASNKAIELYHKLCSDFGLTPAARVNMAPATTQLSLFEPSVVGSVVPKTLGSFNKGR
jgi:P27 family predicted phage terminase small subunit